MGNLTLGASPERLLRHPHRWQLQNFGCNLPRHNSDALGPLRPQAHQAQGQQNQPHIQEGPLIAPNPLPYGGRWKPSPNGPQNECLSLPGQNGLRVAEDEGSWPSESVICRQDRRDSSSARGHSIGGRLQHQPQGVLVGGAVQGLPDPCVILALHP